MEFFKVKVYRNFGKTGIVICPSCKEKLDVSWWSFYGSGKKCKCGGVVSPQGISNKKQEKGDKRNNN